MADDWDDLTKAWLEWLRLERRASASTLDGYKRDMGRFVGHVGGRHRPAQVPPQAFAAFLADLVADGRSASSLARQLSTLRNFFAWLAHERGIVNPAVAALPRVPTLPPAPPRPPPNGQAAAIDDVANLSDDPWIGLRDHAIFLLLSEIGLKLAEVLAMNGSDRPSRINPILVAPPLEGRDGRRVPVTPDVVDAIADYAAACPFDIADDGPLFLGLRGKRLNPGVVQRQMRRLRQIRGLPQSMTPNALRQHLAARLRAQGVPTREIKTRLGYVHDSAALRAAPVGRKRKD